MIITCQKCQTRFRVNPSLIREGGTRVRCSNCQAVFTAFRGLTDETPGFSPISEAASKDIQDDIIDRRIEQLYPNDQDDNYRDELSHDDYLEDSVSSKPHSPPRLTARPPRPAKNNPIGLIKEDGDDFIRPPSIPNRSKARSNNLGLDDDPLAQSWPDRTFPLSEIDSQSGPRPLEQGGASQGYNPPPPPRAKNDAPRGPQPLRPPKPAFSKRQKKLLLALSVAGAFLVISTLLLSLGPGQTLLQPERSPVRPNQHNTAVAQPGGQPSSQPSAPSGQEQASPGQEVINLIFLNELNTHHYLQHPEGQILVLTGRIRNGYDERVSHIRVKAQLKNSQGQVVAERQVFAGNYLEESELTSLSMKEILARLALRGGIGGSNLNIQPGQDVPFMFVFDKLPTDIAEYIIEPISYTPASQALSNLGNQNKPSSL
ncbi:MAG: zinc-ribbon domain-containing protein [Deltaproteobacteria bacterium]|jgi:predicted Zn finger-like uncharacterized protein|nr:zinc-ribbon domain-containing protein [Deltaproteobacteria bacterium]